MNSDNRNSVDPHPPFWTSRHHALARAAAKLNNPKTNKGGVTRLAELLGLRQSTVWGWLGKSERGAAPERCREIERLTGVPAYELRPDVFDAPASRDEDAA